MLKAWSRTCAALLAAFCAAFPAQASIPRHSLDAAAVSLIAASAPSERVGKWLIRDPLGEAGGINLTAFCGNDPINQVDPLGLAIVQGGPIASIAIDPDDELHPIGMPHLGEIQPPNDQPILIQLPLPEPWRDAGQDPRTFITLYPDPFPQLRPGYSRPDDPGFWVGPHPPNWKEWLEDMLADPSPLIPFATDCLLAEIGVRLIPGLGVVRGARRAGCAVATECRMVRASELCLAERAAGQMGGGAASPTRFRGVLDSIGNPRQYWRPDVEQLITQNAWDELALWQGGPHVVEVPGGMSPVLHTHPFSSLPSPEDFMNVPKYEIHYIETPAGGVLYQRIDDFSGIFTEPTSGRLIGRWNPWDGHVIN
jgi:hypothetical protein